MMKDEAQLCAQLGQAIGSKLLHRKVIGVSGGSINSAYVIEDHHRRFFVKQHEKSMVDMFAAEADGLIEIRAAKTIRAPKPLCWGTTEKTSYIVCEHIIFGMGNRDSQAKLGEQLAQLHQHTHAEFGWHRDNTIGATPQTNRRDNNWVRFFAEQRLGYQLTLAERNGAASRLVNNGEKLVSNLHLFFRNYQPDASLLHGDLWSGNYGFDDKGTPVIFDPAVYFGDRETDIAMTELFGGFDRDFYNAYNHAYRLDAGYKARKNLYNLYHVLNHFNLFGGGYEHQAQQLIDRLSAEII